MGSGGRIDYTFGLKLDSNSFKDVKTSLQQLRDLTPKDLLGMNNYSGTTGEQLKQANADLTNLKVTANQVEAAFEKAFNPTTGLTNLQQLNTSLKSIGIENISKNFANGGEVGSQAFYKITKGALTTNMQLRQTNTLLDKMGETLGNTIKWGISSSIMNRFVGSIQQAYGYVQHLDTSLNDIRIVTGKSADEMDRFAEQANKAAKTLGSSTTDYTEAALIYYQQGLSDEESAARAETTIKAANVTGQTGREVSEELTAVWNGYKVTAEETELYVDKLAAVAATTASDLEELSTGMSKVASAANAMGVDVDQLNGMLSTIISVTRQAPETAGTALKTIFARIEDLKISGEDEDGVKLGEVSSTLDAVGVHIMDTQGNMRDLGEVIEEVAGKWDTWTNAQQNAIAQAMAGKRQYNNLLALFNNWDMYTSAVETSQNAVGTLQEQQDTYMESTAAHLQQVKTAWEDFYDSLIDTDDINDVLDIVSGLVTGMARFIDGIGGGKNALLMLGSSAVTVFSKQIGAGITSAIQSITRMKTNAAELQAQLENIQLFKNTSQYQDYAPVTALVDSLEEISQYYNILNNEQINQANSMAQQVADAKELELQWNANTEALKQYQSNLNSGEDGAEVNKYSIANEEFNLGSQKQREQRNQALKDSAEDLEVLSTNIDFIEEQLGEVTGKVNDSSAEITAAWDAIGESVEQTSRIFTDFNKQGLLKDVDPSKIEKISNSLNKMQTYAKKQDFQNLNAELEEFKLETEDLPPKIQKLIDKLLRVNEVGDSIDFSAPAASLKAFLQQAEMQNFVTKLTQGFGALGQFASGLQSLSNMFDTLGDSSLSTKEKVTQFLSSLGMGMTMVITGLTQLPNLFSSLSKIPGLLQQAAYYVASYAGTVDKAAIAEEYLGKMNDEQINSLFKSLNIRKTATAELTAEEYAMVADSAAKEGDIAVTNALTGSTGALNAAIGVLFKTLLTNPLTWVAASIALVAARISYLNKVAQNRAKDAKEEAEAEYQAAKTKAEASEQEYENVKKLVDAYKELKKEYTSDQTSALKQRIYELSQEYGVHIDMITLMGASYEELDGIMNQLLQDISGQATQDSLAALNAQIEAIIAEAESIQLDNSHPFLDFFLKISNLTSSIYDTISEIIDKLTGFKPPEWVQYLIPGNNSPVTNNPFSVAGSSVKTYNQTALSTAPDEVQKVFSLTKSGQLNFDEESFYKELSEVEQKNVQEWLKVQYTENESLAADFTQMIDHSAENALKAISETSSKMGEYRQAFSEYEKQAAEDIYNQEYGEEGITSISKYRQARKKVSSGIENSDLGLTRTETDNLTEQTLQANSSYKVYGGAQILDDLEKTGSFTEKELSEVETHLDSLNDSQVDFVASNLTLLESMKNSGKDVDEIFNNLDGSLNSIAGQEYTVQLNTLIDGKENSKDYKENLEKTFSEVDIGMTQEEFETLDDADRDFILLKKRREVTEENKETIEETNKDIEETNELLDKQIEKQTELAEKERVKNEGEDGTGGLKAQVEEAENAILDESNFDEGIVIDLFGFEEGSQELEDFKQAYTDTMGELIDIYQQATEKGEDGFAAMSDAMDGISDSRITEYLDEYAYQMALVGEKGEDSNEVMTNLVHTLSSSVPSGFSKTKKAYNESNKKLEEYDENLQNLSNSYQDTIEDNHDYAEDLSKTKSAISNLNTSIDSLQTTYQSLESITEDYNDDGKLSLDNLQSLINMDSEYAAALEIQNGVMSINEESMKSAADAKLDMARIEVTEAYLAELDAIAHNQATNANKDFIESELNATSATTGFTDAVNEGYDALLKYAQAKSDAFSVDYDAAETATEAYYNKMQMIDNLSTQSASEILGDSDSSSSSSSSSDPDEEEYLEREEDLYKAINEQLDNIESKLGRIDEIESHSWGINYANNLESQNELLKEQLDLLEEKKDTYEYDLSSQRSELESYGVTFTADGSAMTNTEDVLNSLYDEYNSMVDSYNSMSADEQDDYSDTLEDKKDAIEDIEDAIDDYESAYSDYNSVLDDLLDTHYELIENEVKSFNAKIDVQLELDEAEQEWNDFWYEVVQDVDDTDFSGKIAQSIGKLNTLIGTVGNQQESQVATLTQHLNNTIEEVNKQIAGADNGGGDSIFGDDTALSKETLEDYRDKLMEAVRTAKEEIDEMAETYLDALESAKDLLDDQIEGWEAIGDHIEHNIELIQLVSGEKAYDALNMQFEQQYDNTLNLIETQRMSTEYWKERMEYYEDMMATEEEGSKMYDTYAEALKKASENYRDAVNNLDKAIEDALKDLEEWRKNQVAAISDALDNALSKNMGLEDLKKQWDLVIEEQDYYLDNVERAMEMEGLNDAFNEVLDGLQGRNDLQKEFLKFQDDEVQKLNEKNKLTQYDIDEVKARLEIKKQEMALEEAQQNKSNLRLRRDSQGNYTYQYTANEDDVEEAENGILTAKQEWYELVKRRNEETTNEVIDIRKRLLEAENEMAEALAAHNDEAYNNAKERYEFLINYMTELMGEGEKTKQDFYKGTAEYFADVNNSQILPMWDTTVQGMIDAWSGDGETSFLGSTKKAIEDLETVQDKFNQRTEEILEKAGVKYKDLVSNGIDPTTEALEDMVDTNEELNDTLEETNSTLTELETNLQAAIEAYNSLKDAAVDAINSANETMSTLASTAVSAINTINNAVGTATAAVSSTASSATSSASSGGSSGSDSGSTQYILGKDPSNRSGYYGVYKKGTDTSNTANALDSGMPVQLKKRYKSGEVQGLYKSGGYTGDWIKGIPGTDNGRLAVLHPKELVLNETDTSNILNAVEAIRQMSNGKSNIDATGLASSIINMAQMQTSALANISSSMLQALASMVVNNNSDVSNYRNMTVNADFSGVQSADAIYQALMELDNYGTQQSYSEAPLANTRY